MELTLEQLWYYILELRRDLTRLEIRLLEPQDELLDVPHELAKLRLELSQLNDKLVPIQQAMQRPSI
jgi:hypothetical protein